MAGRAGYKGKVSIGAVTVNDMMVWAYSGSVKDTADDSALGQAHKTFIPLQGEGGEITMSGNFLLDSDAGQQLLETHFNDETQITDLRLYFSATNYLELDSTTDPASYASVTKYDEVSVDKTGLLTVACSLKVSGKMKLNSSTSSVSCNTIGALDEAADSVTLIGELVSIGEETSVDAYFEYGTTTSYGTDTSVSATTLTAVDIFDNAITGLDALTTYHYRAVIELEDTSKVYGADKTFTTSS